MKKLDSALGEFKIALNLNPKNGSIFTLIGHTYNQKGDYDSAIKAYKSSIKFRTPDIGVVIANGQKTTLRNNGCI